MSLPLDRDRRKRKWDATVDEGGDSNDAAVAAAAAAAAAASARRAHGSDKPFREFVINDHRGYRHAMMSANIRAVEMRHKVVIVSKGRYIAPDDMQPSDDAPDDQKKLFLKIKGDTEEQVNEAIKHIENIMVRGGTTGDYVKVWADMDVMATPYLDVIDRLRGVDDEYLKYIEAESGVSVTVSGRGSSPTYSGRENLHLLLKAPENGGNISKAKALCYSLVKTVQGVFDEYRQQYFGIAPTRRHGSGRWINRSKDTVPPSVMNAAPMMDSAPPPPPGNHMMHNAEGGAAPPPPPPPPMSPPPPPPDGPNVGLAASVPDIPPPPPPG